MPRNSLDPRSEYPDYAHMSAKDHFVGASSTIFTLVKEVSDLIPNAGPLSQVLGITGQLFAIVNQVKTNKDDCEYLVERILRFLKKIGDQCKRFNVPIPADSPTDMMLKELTSMIKLIMTHVEIWKASSFWHALSHRDTVKDAILKHNRNLDDCFVTFTTGMLVQLVSQATNSASQNIPLDGLAEGNIFRGLVAREAMYDRGDARVSCLAGTRQAPIEEFFRWVRDGVTLIYWFSGPAGYGKSAISQSIAERCEREHILAATFFFLRAAGLRSDIKYLITTLAYQLSQWFPATKSIIESALREDERIDSQSTKNQLEKLIIRPLTALVGHQETPLVIIIDALDECKDRKAMQDFIGILASACSNHQLPVRFLLTSRVEDHIRHAFLGVVAASATTSLELETFDAGKDINTYLRSCFSEILRNNSRLTKDLPSPWPSAKDLLALEKQSNGMFIFASILAKFITDGNAPPDEKLKAVLNLHTNGLDLLYMQVLTDVPDAIVGFRAVLTTLMLVREQPSIRLLADLLQIGTTNVLHALMPIQSIIRIPADDDTPIQLNHTSLRDFLEDEDRSQDLFIDPSTAHLTLAADCVKLMKMTLRPDEFPTDAASKYAAKYGLVHLGDSGVPSQDSSDTLSTLTDVFSSEAAPLIFNVVVWSESYDESIDALVKYFERCKHIKGNKAFLRALREIQISWQARSLIAPILCC